MKCNFCQKEVIPKKPPAVKKDGATKSEKLPPGWKNHNAQTYCANCWHDHYILRAITFPIASPVTCKWEELRAALKDSWRKATRLANLAVQQLLIHDVVRTEDMKKLPAKPPFSLYQACIGEGYDGWSQSATCVLRAVEKKYIRTRYERIWLGQVRLPNTRYPMPFPLHNAAWEAFYPEEGDKVPHVRFTLPGSGKTVVRLRGGKEFRRQLGSFAKIVSGEAIKGEMSIYEVRASVADHRNGGDDKGGYTRYMVKMVAWLPRPPKRELEGTLHVKTDTDCLLMALDEKNEKLWTLNFDHVRRWCAEHRRQLHRWSEDQKAEQRPTASFQARRTLCVEKHKNRMDSSTHEAAAQLVKFAARRGYAVIEYNDAIKSYVGEMQFPWFRLKSLIEQKADAAGIEFVAVGSEEKQKEKHAASAKVAQQGAGNARKETQGDE